MMALTIWQPHATLLAIGARTIETRGWHTNYRGPLVIHAATRWNGAIEADVRAAALVLSEPGMRLTTEQQAFTAIPWRETLGRVLAIADLVDCRPIPEPEGTVFDRYLGGFGPGRWGWFLRNPRLVQPANRFGRQGLWQCNVDDLRPFTTAGSGSPPALFPLTDPTEDHQP